eukprot:5854174-Ditylum_brightwellii.AAC.1
MSATDRLLFVMPLEERMNTSHDAKFHLLASVHIAVQDITVVHKCTPYQRVMTDFFQATQQNNQPRDKIVPEEVDIE